MKYLKADFLIPFLWFCVMQPMIFLVSMAILAMAVYDSLVGLI